MPKRTVDIFRMCKRDGSTPFDDLWYSSQEVKKLCREAYLIGLNNGTINNLNEYVDKELK
jgi:hypothetical protein